MQCLRPRTPRYGLNQRSSWVPRRTVASNTKRLVTQIPTLESWDLDSFRERAFNPAQPYRLPFIESSHSPAWTRWFNTSSSIAHADHDISQLNLDFWRKHADEVVPLEITRQDPISHAKIFEKIECPLALLIAHIGSTDDQVSVYLAQHSLPSLPQALRDDLPTPELVEKAGKGDVYDSSLWLGKAPTYTPLHRDPNPNLFLQIAGRKLIRMFPPEIGESIFEHVRSCAGTGQSDARFRGEEMMHGQERELLYGLVWGEKEGEQRRSEQEMKNSNSQYAALSRYALEAVLTTGEALFIPKGWWHSVRGVGQGVVGSVNWWFR